MSNRDETVYRKGTIFVLGQQRDDGGMWVHELVICQTDIIAYEMLTIFGSDGERFNWKKMIERGWVSPVLYEEFDTGQYPYV